MLNSKSIKIIDHHWSVSFFFSSPCWERRLLARSLSSSTCCALTRGCFVVCVSLIIMVLYFFNSIQVKSLPPTCWPLCMATAALLIKAEAHQTAEEDSCSDWDAAACRTFSSLVFKEELKVKCYPYSFFCLFFETKWAFTVSSSITFHFISFNRGLMKSCEIAK